MSDPGPITGHQRIAAFLLSLEPQTAKNILRHLDGKVVEEVARAMVDLDPRLAGGNAVNQLYRELAISIHGPTRVRSCGTGELSTMLADTFGQAEAQRIVAQIEERRRSDRPFLEIERHPAKRIALALEPESVAVAALVLGNLEPAAAAEVLKFGQEERVLATVRRMADLDKPPASVLKSIAAQLADRLEALERKGGGQADVNRLQSIAEILNYSSPDIERKIIDFIGEKDADMAAELREYMFTWEDIATIDKRSMQKILGTVDTKTLSVALKACSAAVEDNLMGNLSSRVRDMVAEERELSGAVSMDNVLAAREEIMKNIRAMIEAGEFSPARAGEDLVA